MNTSNYSPKTKVPFKQNHQGFTLVELMIAITLGFIVVGAVGYLYLSARQSFRTTDNMSRMQENARLAIETLARDVRMAGYVGCINLQSGSATIYTIAKPPVPALSPSVAITGLDSGASTVAFLGTTITRPAGDTISVMGAFGGGVPLVGNLPPNNANVQINGNPHKFADEDVLIVSDCKNADVFKVTGIASAPGTVTLSHASSTNVSNNVGAYTSGSVYKMEHYTYFIGENSYGKRALYRTNTIKGTAENTMELVEDVWDMQIEYGMDTNADGSADTYKDATGVSTNWNQVVSARISLLLVSPENNVLTSSQTYNYKGSSVKAGAGDKRLYQVLTSTIALRNRAP